MKFTGYVNLTADQLNYDAASHKVTISSAARSGMELYPTMRDAEAALHLAASLANRSLQTMIRRVSYAVSAEIPDGAHFKVFGSVDQTEGAKGSYVAGRFYSYQDAFRAADRLGTQGQRGIIKATPDLKIYDSVLEFNIHFDPKVAKQQNDADIDLISVVELDDEQALAAVNPRYAAYLELKQEFEPAG